MVSISNGIIDSFSDYDGHHSLTIFTTGCNFDCYHCYNKEKMKENNYKARDYIDKNITSMHTGLVILGGEPTIHGNELINFMKWFKDKYSLDIKLFTNGSKYDIIENIVEKNLIDFFSIDFKAINNIKDVIGVDFDYDVVTDTIDLVYGSDIGLEIRTTNLSLIDEGVIKEFVSKRWSDVNHIVQADMYDNLSDYM